MCWRWRNSPSVRWNCRRRPWPRRRRTNGLRLTLAKIYLENGRQGQCADGARNPGQAGRQVRGAGRGDTTDRYFVTRFDHAPWATPEPQYPTRYIQGSHGQRGPSLAHHEKARLVLAAATRPPPGSFIAGVVAELGALFALPPHRGLRAGHPGPARAEDRRHPGRTGGLLRAAARRLRGQRLHAARTRRACA